MNNTVWLSFQNRFELASTGPHDSSPRACGEHARLPSPPVRSRRLGGMPFSTAQQRVGMFDSGLAAISAVRLRKLRRGRRAKATRPPGCCAYQDARRVWRPGMHRRSPHPASRTLWSCGMSPKEIVAEYPGLAGRRSRRDGLLLRQRRGNPGRFPQGRRVGAMG